MGTGNREQGIADKTISHYLLPIPSNKEFVLLRDAVVAGMFYEKDAHALREHVDKYIIKPDKKFKAKGIIVPHAGYVYSGAVAGEVFSSVEIPDTIIIMGPNHTGSGPGISVMNEGVWRTPLGDAKINGPLADEIIKNSQYAKADSTAHAREHSIEVKLPFIQRLKKSFTFVPIIFAEEDTKALKEVACAIRETMRDKDILLIASTDLTHYESAESAKQKDKLVLDAIEKMDPDLLAEEVYKNRISMCGWMPTYVMLFACKLLGCKKAEIIKYTNSGETSGDFDQVVGYGGAAII